LRREQEADRKGSESGDGAYLTGKPAAGRRFRAVVNSDFHVLQKCNPSRGCRGTGMYLLLARESSGTPRLIE
jgi:hypothetical protein